MLFTIYTGYFSPEYLSPEYIFRGTITKFRIKIKSKLQSQIFGEFFSVIVQLGSRDFRFGSSFECCFAAVSTLKLMKDVHA
jgi:hypothetical protein